MIGNCRGCVEEFDVACSLVRDNDWLHVATTCDNHFLGKGHLMILLVDDDGNVVIT